MILSSIYLLSARERSVRFGVVVAVRPCAEELDSGVQTPHGRAVHVADLSSREEGRKFSRRLPAARCGDSDGQDGPADFRGHCAR